MPYLLDANVFIEAKNRHYGFDICPGFWDWLISRNANGVIFSIDAVLDELKRGEDELTDWAKLRGSNFFLRPPANANESMASIVEWVHAQNYDDCAVSSFCDNADFQLVAHALTMQWTVVTHEKRQSGRKAVKIPAVCDGFSLECITTPELLRREGARLVMTP